MLNYRFKMVNVPILAFAVLLGAIGIILIAHVACQSLSTEDPCSVKENQTMVDITREQVDAVIEANVDLLVNHPDPLVWGAEFVPAQMGNSERGRWYILIMTDTRTDQSALPENDRIPDCLNGIPVIWEEGVIPITPDRE